MPRHRYTGSCGCSCCINGRCADPSECDQVIWWMCLILTIIAVFLCVFIVCRAKRRNNTWRAMSTSQRTVSSSSSPPTVPWSSSYQQQHYPKEKCPHDGMCMLVNDAAHQMQYLHTCAFPNCPYIVNPYHNAVFIH
eukprot:PhF_6_TR29158/c0_g1_i1/m.42619